MKPRHWERAHIEHRGYCICIKKDFDLSNPPFVDGMPVIFGFIVVYKDGELAGANAMPDSTWFQTVKAAKHGIDVLIDVGGEQNAEKFWALLRQETACRHFRYVLGPTINTPNGVFQTHVCTCCGEWRTETHALSQWQPAATLKIEAAATHAIDGRREAHLTAANPAR